MGQFMTERALSDFGPVFRRKLPANEAISPILDILPDELTQFDVVLNKELWNLDL